MKFSLSMTQDYLHLDVNVSKLPKKKPAQSVYTCNALLYSTLCIASMIGTMSDNKKMFSSGAKTKDLDFILFLTSANFVLFEMSSVTYLST